MGTRKVDSDSAKQRNRRVRTEALREQLSNKGLLQHVIETSNKLEDLTVLLEPADVVRLKAAAELKLKLVNKYLPDEKPVEITGEVDNNLHITWGTHSADNTS